MFTALILFGLRLAPLYRAIAQVESDNGKTSANVYQISVEYVEDVNRISGLSYTLRDLTDRDKCEMMMWHYWLYYGRRYEAETGCAPTYEVLARIHNGGPHGWAKLSTQPYWNKVRKEMGK